MQTLTAPVWLLGVLGVLAVCGFVAVCWLVAGWAERAADWWHDRERPVDPPWWWKLWLFRRNHFDEDDFEEVGPPPLPPERTWEQMTSHQLPLTAERERVVPSLLGSRQATAHFRKLEKARKRRWMVVSAEIWRAYEALGLEGTGFTRAMARQVKELVR